MDSRSVSDVYYIMGQTLCGLYNIGGILSKDDEMMTSVGDI